MHTVINLTVAEGKRLIAKGVVRHPLIMQALQNATVAIAPGTTNGYVIEEITGEKIDKTRFVTGRTLPAAYAGVKPKYDLPDLVVRRGKRLSMSAVEAAAQMQAGDIFIKGANAINYEKNQAGVLIGHPSGGTIGAVLGRLVAQKIDLIHPVGLEKQIHVDLHQAAATLREPGGTGPALWVTPGELFTEIEAIQTLAAVEAVPLAAGGIGGAEGGIWLALLGEKDGLDQALEVLADIQGEPPFIQ